MSKLVIKNILAAALALLLALGGCAPRQPLGAAPAPPDNTAPREQDASVAEESAAPSTDGPDAGAHGKFDKPKAEASLAPENDSYATLPVEPSGPNAGELTPPGSTETIGPVPVAPPDDAGAPADVPEETAAPSLAALAGEDMLPDISDSGDTMFSIAASANVAGLDLSIPAEFAVARPDKRETTTSATYYVMGTSDPSRPVYFDGQEVARQGTKGAWGVLVNLALGTNIFTASQGDASATVTIVRNPPASPTPIGAIVQGSMYPATQGGGQAGGTLAVECVAPSGAAVTASFGGQTVTLQQQANAAAGMAAAFRGALPLGTDYPAGQTTRQGKVRYRLTYNGATTEYESTGEVFIAGQGSYIAVRVTAYQGFVYENPANLSVFREKLKTGAADYVYAEDNEYYRLYSGGFIPKEQCEIIEGIVRIGNRVLATRSSADGNKERYAFAGEARPAYRAYYGEGNTFVLTLYNTAGSALPNVGDSRLFSSVRAVAGDNSSVTYIFQFRDPALYWGYNVYFNGNDLILSISAKPALSQGNFPLRGVTVMLDPGHGGADPGALGFTGAQGPTENILNMANAYALRDVLEAMGARVLLTRENPNIFYELDERLMLFEAGEADFFLSLHHNSLGVSADGSKAQGTEVYYHTPHSQGSAERILTAVAEATGRQRRKASQSYYRVTLLPTSPAMLVELGFLCNPAEFELLCSEGSIADAARGIANGIVQALR